MQRFRDKAVTERRHLMPIDSAGWICYNGARKWIEALPHPRESNRISLKKLHDDSGDKSFWLSKTPKQRLEALAELRRQYFEIRQEPEPGLQRVLNIINRSKS